MSEPFLAQITMFAGNFAPRGWAFCDGQFLLVAQNSALFSLLGTTYGGDGRTNFALPDLRGRVPMHPGSGPGLTPRTLGEKAGAEHVTLNVNQLPAHDHPVEVEADVRCSNQAGTSDSPSGKVWSGSSEGDQGYRDSANSSMAKDAVAVSAQVGNRGEGQPVDKVQPFLGVNFIIALQGIFPSRT